MALHVIILKEFLQINISNIYHGTIRLVIYKSVFKKKKETRKKKKQGKTRLTKKYYSIIFLPYKFKSTYLSIEARFILIENYKKMLE